MDYEAQKRLFLASHDRSPFFFQFFSVYLSGTCVRQSAITQASELLGRHRVTLQDWLAKYRRGGLESLLGRGTSPGRPRKIPSWAEKALAKRLQEPEGFESYNTICQWLEANLGIKANYKTVHSLVYYRLKASPKIARPQSLEQSPERLSAFKKTF